MVDKLLQVAPIAAGLGALTFVVVYQVYGKWWVSEMGRHLMSFMLGCFVVLGIAVLVRFDPHLPHIKAVKIGAWSIVTFLMWWRAVVAIRVLILKKYPGLDKDE